MNTITLNQAELNLRQIMQKIINNLEPTIVVDEDGQSVVMLSLEEFNSWQETLYLLSTPANAEHLQRSIAEDKANYTTKQDLIDP